jgi:hypothetical protein
MRGRKNILEFPGVEPLVRGDLGSVARFYRVFSGTLPVRRFYTDTGKCFIFIYRENKKI